ncbi:hypothetical protein [Mesorhizobium sp. M00.F.Ca.ET.217.01.1.1]|uniref:hypothetical protein n=1 Tax=Mesorhizobium sp. M00.F.Ca.ET.217.01.1.1 TaxID=2500529 RepID=UPI000FDC229B|nr:hypothetical protein [Mesorhizobium sp. M00.F.Ca.ET.217.01.1.1]TGQ19354.1 hypothetical protein EN860_019700 [Mesorhizobium sp. M00.F.Ca.ET.217.01.1.1]
MLAAERIEAAYIPRHSPWGDIYDVPANDNRPQIMVGLTGLRNVGKSTVANLLRDEFGFVPVHAFASGKEAVREWFVAIGIDAETAWEMVYGDLKDVPSPDLPGGVAPRFFLEKFGHFMGATMGVEWTLGLEVALARRRNPRKPIVVESLVYDAPWFRRHGGAVWRLERPGHEGPAGVESDAVQAAIAADATISATEVEDLKAKARAAAQQIVGGS